MKVHIKLADEIQGKVTIKKSGKEKRELKKLKEVHSIKINLIFNQN